MSDAASTVEGSEIALDADWNAAYIDGEWRRLEGRERIDVTNPSTGEVITQVPAASRDDVDEAFAAAKEAQVEWEDTSLEARASVVRNVAKLLEEYEDEVREILAAEGGSAKSKQDIEWGGSVSFGYDAAQYAYRADGRHAQSQIPGKENIVERKPVGVVGVISPWNVPLKLSFRAVAPAIATGNSVVLKPAEDTSISGGLLLARLFEEAGLPDGVLNVVPGEGATAGDQAASHPDCDVMAFTGSTRAGRIVGKNVVDHFGFPALELGGNNPHVVLEDADLDKAVDAGTFGSFWNQGQVCISINRHIVHEDVYDEYAERLAERAKELKVGNPVGDDDVVVGPIINESQRDQMMEYVEETVEAGGEVLAGGEADGLFVEPTVITNVTNDMAAACNEHFGPIVPVIPFSDDEEAVEIANDTEYGLAGSVHSGDLGRARDVADQIDVGMMHVNDQTVNVEPHMPFGGMKESGIGRYNGEYIIDEFTEVKWTSVQREDRGYPF
ncbi:aldehyde dehydrogenase (NAD+) [Halarchaeum rubridurum]|uniref:Aldehyde dehydrogenase n=1 Tax=Halarchaeum rubridurum TaxID=489911 RepID=A0A830FU49_9EURY|nr:aldehyde dehydrogenase family protein [Halarchaeum rubridurum]MBP1954439.1 aldehyde dehydrogenase (NAD+) [Halarchaeum rubridurum]GGM61002.1 aldehyde dehydrogenase [Halarchaeum rubridurum]